MVAVRWEGAELSPLDHLPLTTLPLTPYLLCGLLDLLCQRGRLEGGGVDARTASSPNGWRL